MRTPYVVGLIVVLMFASGLTGYMTHKIQDAQVSSQKQPIAEPTIQEKSGSSHTDTNQAVNPTPPENAPPPSIKRDLESTAGKVQALIESHFGISLGDTSVRDDILEYYSSFSKDNGTPPRLTTQTIADSQVGSYRVISLTPFAGVDCEAPILSPCVTLILDAKQALVYTDINTFEFLGRLQTQETENTNQLLFRKNEGGVGGMGGGIEIWKESLVDLSTKDLYTRIQKIEDINGSQKVEKFESYTKNGIPTDENTINEMFKNSN